MKQKGMEMKKREEIKKNQLKIIKDKAQHSCCKLKNVDGKEEVQCLFWIDKEIGEYIVPQYLGPTLVKFGHHILKWKQIHMLVERAALYKVLKIYYGLSNLCPCWEIDLDSRSLIGHVKVMKILDK